MRNYHLKAAIYLLVLLALWAAACSSQDASAPQEANGGVASKSEALGGSCSPGGVCNFSIELPEGVGFDRAAIVASNEVHLRRDVYGSHIDKRAWVVNTGTDGATGRTAVEAGSELGPMWSAASTTLGATAVVAGDVISTAEVVQATPVPPRVTGDIRQFAPAPKLRSTSWSVTWPNTPGPSLTAYPGQPVTLAPGVYGNVATVAGGIVALSAGTYFFDELEIGGELRVPDNAPVHVYVRRRLVASSYYYAVSTGGPSPPGNVNIAFHYSGSADVVVWGGFSGTIIAPNALVQIKKNSKPYTGAVYARQVHVYDADVVHRAFTRSDCATADPQGCGDVFGCPARDTDGDSLSDCSEINDGDAWTDYRVFNGLRITSKPRCHVTPTCSDIDTAGEIATCGARVATPVATQDHSAGWNWTVPSTTLTGSAETVSGTDLCSGMHAFKPSRQVCGDGVQLDATGKLKLDRSGIWCFSVAGEPQSSGECGALLVGGSTSAIVTGAVRCEQYAAGVYDIRWFWEGATGTDNGLRVRSCYGGAANCTPTEAISNRALRAQHTGSDPLCEPGGPCTDACPCQDGQGTCTANTQCASGYCPPTPNGVYYGLSGTARVCEPAGPICDVAPASAGCGYPNAPCGDKCTTRKCCTANADCTGGEVCGANNGYRFGAPCPRVCVPPICETDPVMGGCGDEREPCGVCTCVSNCSGKTCGGDKKDGCGGECPGVCASGEPGCTEDIHCAAGTECIAGACRPPDCRRQDIAPPYCGSGNSVCGPCPSSNQCAGRQCGADPYTGASCGACFPNQYCSAAGQCVLRPLTSGLDVPTGNGGTRTVEPLPPGQTSVIGAVAGGFAVSDRGTATYSIPIAVPPGRVGLQPDLALVYQGVGANGQVGVGWDVSGKSKIYRCATSWALDRFPSGPKNAPRDALCLDGKRLIGKYRAGQPSIEYRTAIDTFARINAERGSDGQPISFKVWTKDGRILYYGEDITARITSPDGTATHTWLLDRIEDRFKNYVDYRYFRTGNGRFQGELTSILYTGNGVTPGDREVRLAYEDRPDIDNGFTADGVEYLNTRRLARISTYVQGTAIRSYELGYQTSSNGMSLVREIRECDGETSNCKTPTRFEYLEESGFKPSVEKQFVLPRGLYADVNGDGLLDVFEVEQQIQIDKPPPWAKWVDFGMNFASFAPYGIGQGAVMAWSAYRSQWGEYTSTYKYRIYESQRGVDLPFRKYDITGLGQTRIKPLAFSDLNSDHRDELVQPCTNGFCVRPYAGAGQFTYDRTLPGAGTYKIVSDWQLVDITGDGIQDLIGRGCTGRPLLVLRPGLPGGGLGADINIDGVGSCNQSRFIFDINGDGVSDVVQYDQTTKSYAVLELSVDLDDPAQRVNYSWRQNAIVPSGKLQNLGVHTVMGDFNGDGLTDMLSVWHGEQPLIWLNTGGRLKAALLRGPRLPSGANSSYAVLDYDRDGRDDILQIKDGVATLRRGTSNLAEYEERSIPGITRAWTHGLDVDGDDNVDLVAPFGDTHSIIYPGTGSKNHLLKRVVDGLGNYVDVKYELTNSSGSTYVAGTACKWPQRCLARVPSLVSEYVVGVHRMSRDVPYQRFSHRYIDARVDLAGHGWLGFAKRHIRQEAWNSVELGAQPQPRSDTLIEYEPPQRYTLAGVRLNDEGSWGYVYPKAGLSRLVVTTTQPASSPLTRAAFAQQSVKAFDWQVKVGGDQGTPFAVLRSLATLISENALLDVVTAHSSIDEFDYDTFGNPIRSKVGGPTTVETVYSYYKPDYSSWRIAQPSSQVVKSTRTVAGQPVSATAAYSFTYDATTGALRTSTYSGRAEHGRRTTLTQDAFGNTKLSQDTDLTTGVTRSVEVLEFDSSNIFPQRVKNGLGHVSQFRFDLRHGFVSIAADPNGVTIRRSYDSFGNLTQAEDPTGSRSTVSIGAPESTPLQLGSTAAFQVTTTLPNGQRHKQGVDSFGRPVYTRSLGYDGVEVITKRLYDPAGRLVSETLPHLPDNFAPPTYQFEYDARDRLTAIMNPEHTAAAPSSRTYSYGRRGTLSDSALNGSMPAHAFDVVISTDEEGRSEQRVHDVAGNLLRVSDGAGGVVSYEYGPFNQVRSALDATGTGSTFSYDAYGNLLSVTDPNTGTTTQSTDAFGQTVRVEDAKAQVTTYAYDVLGRVKTATAPEGVTTWTYDTTDGILRPNQIGRLLAVEAPPVVAGRAGHKVTYEYEPPSAASNRGLLKSVTETLDGIALKTGYEYDDLGRIAKLHYPSSPHLATGSGQPAGAPGLSIAYQYDGPHLRGVDHVTSAGSTRLWRVEAVKDGTLVTRESLSHGVSTHYDYEPSTLRIKSIETMRQTGTTPSQLESLQKLVYEYYRNDLVKSVTAPSGLESYTYDAANRLRTATRTAAGTTSPVTETYDYSPTGNLLTKPDVGTYMYAPSRPQLLARAGSSTYFSYQANGNQWVVSNPVTPSQNRSVVYSSFDMPKRISNATNAIDLEYNAYQQRAVKRGSTSTTYYTGKSYRRVVPTSNPAALPSEQYAIHVGGRQVAEISRSAADGSLTTYNIGSDLLGSALLITGPGSVQRQSFTPFGTPRSGAPQGGVVAGFTGHEHDREFGLVNMGGRIYDPRFGRFLTADPFSRRNSAQGWNRFSYVRNNPTTYNDPSGFIDEMVWAGVGVGAGMGGVVAAGELIPPSIGSGILTGGSGSSTAGGVGSGASITTAAGIVASGGMSGAMWQLLSGMPSGIPQGGTIDPSHLGGQRHIPSGASAAHATAQNQPGVLRQCDVGICLAQNSHDDKVIDLVQAYRNASDAPYQAWDRAREDYRNVRLSGGDPVLRDAEHFLLRYWLAFEGGRWVWIPRNLTSVAAQTPWWDKVPVPMNVNIMGGVHDPLYNSIIRPALEKAGFNIAPAGPSMETWESRGYMYGFHDAPSKLSPLVKGPNGLVFYVTF